MKRLYSILLLITLLITGKAKADEGMWLLPLLQELNMETMHNMGLKLSAEDIYSINNSSLKDAIVIFGKGCTGEIISDQGLLLTNHHCGYGEIQELSSLENNYLEQGFWASNLHEELPAAGLSVTFLVSMRDVTNEVLQEINADMTESQRRNAITKKSSELIEENNENKKYNVIIKDFFAGNQYFMLVYQEYKDVRLVGTPPSAIGKFGYDTDNWMWPRHTGDFALFRVYADAEGNPADYSPENVPYKPAHHLPISIKGYEKDDFAMTLGNPGSTQRYLPSWGIEERMNVFNNTLIKVRGEKQDIWAEAMAENEKIKLQYATKYSRSSNYWKNSIGMNKGLEALDVLSKKQSLEKELADWINNDNERINKYGQILTNLENAYTNRASHYLANIYIRETLIRGTEILNFAESAKNLETALISRNNKKISEEVNHLREKAEAFYKDYDATTDQKVLAKMIELYANDISKEHQPSFFEDLKKKYKQNYNAYATNLFSNSIFSSNEKLNKFLSNPKLRSLQRDEAFKAGKSVMEKYRDLFIQNTQAELEITAASRLFIQALKEMQPEKVFYPDANFTMRLSYGTVGDYAPRDAVIYKHYTTLAGVMEKEDADNFEFFVPEKLKELHRTNNYGRYAAADGRMYVNFTTNNDITGGNSGSPVINGSGELIGLAFDGNWEAMSGDIAFENELQKCINVDIRYILFIIDKFANASHLIEEMTIIE